MKAPEALCRRFPERLAAQLWEWFIKNQVQLIISKQRKSCFGSFKAATEALPPRITVNGGLNNYHFYFVLLHEMAHFITRQRFNGRVMTHGREWKTIFKELFFTFIPGNFIPSSIEAIIPAYFDERTSLSDAHVLLMRAIQPHTDNGNSVALETLPDGTRFTTLKGGLFLKMKLRRKRFICRCITTGRLYAFLPLAFVIPVAD